MAQWDERNQTGEGSSPMGGNGHANAEGGLASQFDQQHIQEAIENAREQIDQYVETAADFIRERPVLCLAGAAAIGFLVGKLASRR